MLNASTLCSNNPVFRHPNVFPEPIDFELLLSTGNLGGILVRHCSKIARVVGSDLTRVKRLSFFQRTTL